MQHGFGDGLVLVNRLSRLKVPYPSLCDDAHLSWNWNRNGGNQVKPLVVACRPRRAEVREGRYRDRLQCRQAVGDFLVALGRPLVDIWISTEGQYSKRRTDRAAGAGGRWGPLGALSQGARVKTKDEANK